MGRGNLGRLPPQVVPLCVKIGFPIRDGGIDKTQREHAALRLKNENPLFFPGGLRLIFIGRGGGDIPILQEIRFNLLHIAFGGIQQDEAVENPRFILLLLLNPIGTFPGLRPGLLYFGRPLHPVSADHLHHGDGVLLGGSGVVRLHLAENMTAMLRVGRAFIAAADAQEPFAEQILFVLEYVIVHVVAVEFPRDFDFGRLLPELVFVRQPIHHGLQGRLPLGCHKFLSLA
ncbi:hypothetical protein D1872_236740 [compost metagenome]